MPPEVRVAKEGTMPDEMKKEPKWYASGRGIFRRDAGFQMGTMVATANWQEDTARFVELLNLGEEAKRAGK
jgi:hypothetical protein